MQNVRWARLFLKARYLRKSMDLQNIRQRHVTDACDLEIARRIMTAWLMPSLALMFMPEQTASL